MCKRQTTSAHLLVFLHKSNIILCLIYNHYSSNNNISIVLNHIGTHYIICSLLPFSAGDLDTMSYFYDHFIVRLSLKMISTLNTLNWGCKVKNPKGHMFLKVTQNIRYKYIPLPILTYIWPSHKNHNLNRRLNSSYSPN